MEGSEVSCGHRRCADQAGLKVLRSSVQRSPRAVQLNRFTPGCPASVADLGDEVAVKAALTVGVEPDAVDGPVAVWSVGGVPVIGLADSVEFCSGRLLTKHVMAALSEAGLSLPPELVQPE